MISIMVNEFIVAGSLFHICFSGVKADCDVDLELPSGNSYCSEWNVCGYTEYEPPENRVSESSTDESSEVEGDAGDGFVNQYASGSSLSEDGSISEGENEQTVPSDFEVSSVSSASEAAGDEAQSDFGDGV